MRAPTPVSIATLRRLKDQIAAMQQISPAAAGDLATRVALGPPDVDAALKGGLKRNALHEIEPETSASMAASLGFVLALAHRAAAGQPVILLHQQYLEVESGRIHAQGLAEWGLDPGNIILFRARSAETVLRASLEAAHCQGLGSAIAIVTLKTKSDWLTISRKFSLAAETSGVPLFFLNAGEPQKASAAATRWRVEARPSLPLAANAPGHMRCSINLVRHRGGMADLTWNVEWNRDNTSFAISSPVRDSPRRAPLSRPLVSVSSGLSGHAALRKAG
jgi:protein ImuA